MEQGVFSVPHGLHTIGCVIIDKLNRGGQTSDSKKCCCIADSHQSGVCICRACTQEQPCHRSSKDFRQHDANNRDQQPPASCGVDGFLHTLPVSGRIVISHDWQHTQTDTDVDCIGDPLYFHNDAHTSQNQIVMRGSKLVINFEGKVAAVEDDCIGKRSDSSDF